MFLCLISFLLARPFSFHTVSIGVVGCLEKRRGCFLSHLWRCGRHFASAAACPHPPIVRISRAVPVCISFRLGISPRQSVSPRPSCRTRRGARRGETLPPPCLICPIQFNRAVFSNSNSSPFFSPPCLLLPVCLLELAPAPGRGRRGRFGRFAAAGVRAACLRFHFLVPLSRSPLVRYRCRVRFPFDGII